MKVQRERMGTTLLVGVPDEAAVPGLIQEVLESLREKAAEFGCIADWTTLTIDANETFRTKTLSGQTIDSDRGLEISVEIVRIG